MRGVVVILAAVLSCVAIASPNAQQRGAQPTGSAERADENLILSVPATAPWTDSGLVVRAGDRLEIRAWGAVSYGDAASAVTPNGLERGGGCSFVVTNNAVPAHALVANVAPQ